MYIVLPLREHRFFLLFSDLKMLDRSAAILQTPVCVSACACSKYLATY